MRAHARAYRLQRERERERERDGRADHNEAAAAAETFEFVSSTIFSILCIAAFIVALPNEPAASAAGGSNGKRNNITLTTAHNDQSGDPTRLTAPTLENTIDSLHCLLLFRNKRNHQMLQLELVYKWPAINFQPSWLVVSIIIIISSSSSYNRMVRRSGCARWSMET